MSNFDQPLPPFNASDPTASFLSSSCLDLLLIEIVPMAYRVANEVDAASSESIPHSAKSAAETAAGTTGTSPGGAADGTAAGRTSGRLDEEEERDAVFYRLETLGYRVGLGLVERFSRDRPRFNDTLDVIKFLCKDLWTLVFKKQIDNLKTNHRGVYVLTDNAFRPLARMSTETGGQAVLRAQPGVIMKLSSCGSPCGIVRGALAALGINATVQAETSELPGAVFQIKTLPNKP
ncbi:transport protein particle component [Apiospora phragmitis]|uniref:Transport protein particle component n=1 Tax=Apiospora phragmitis TaxID=2905665 RepID=A0ABR1TRL9_9PEZI